MAQIKVNSWNDIKSFVDSRGLGTLQFVETSNIYEIVAVDNYFELYYQMSKNPADLTDLNDFETNYKPSANIRLSQKDIENALVVRMKQAPSGWTYQAHTFEFCTSKLNSTISEMPDGSSTGFITMKLYNSQGVEIVDQLIADTDCVETHVDWEPRHDYEVLSGKVFSKEQNLTEDVRLWVVGVPDLTVEQGGSKVMVCGINLNYVDAFQPIETDGRVSKMMKYDATYHTNKLRFIVKHPAGFKFDLMFIMEIFKV